MCRYLIHAKDLLKVTERFEQSSPGASIAFRIDQQVVLEIIVSQMSLRDETIRQLIGRRRNRILEKVSETLGIGRASEQSSS